MAMVVDRNALAAAVRSGPHVVGLIDSVRDLYALHLSSNPAELDLCAGQYSLHCGEFTIETLKVICVVKSKSRGTWY